MIPLPLLKMPGTIHPATYHINTQTSFDKAQNLIIEVKEL